ncbi:MAG: hypothetical protein NC122_10950, partial [Faecalibacterium sp.]|nr:hypothetical protein [Faecalibacterium sp.]
DILYKVFSGLTVLIQTFSTIWVLIRLINQAFRKNNCSEIKELKIRRSVFLFGYLMVMIIGIATLNCRDDLCMLCLFFFFVLVAFFIMLFQARWKIQYGGNEVYVQNFFGKRKTYLKNELTEQYSGRITSIFCHGKRVAEYDLLLVKTEDSVSLSRFIYERERLRNQTKCKHRKRKK